MAIFCTHCGDNKPQAHRPTKKEHRNEPRVVRTTSTWDLAARCRQPTIEKNHCADLQILEGWRNFEQTKGRVQVKMPWSWTKCIGLPTLCYQSLCISFVIQPLGHNMSWQTGERMSMHFTTIKYFQRKPLRKYLKQLYTIKYCPQKLLQKYLNVSCNQALSKETSTKVLKCVLKQNWFLWKLLDIT